MLSIYIYMAIRLHNNAKRLLRYTKNLTREFKSRALIDIDAGVESYIPVYPEGGVFKFTDIPLIGANDGSDGAEYMHYYVDSGLKLFVYNIGAKAAGSSVTGNDNGVNYSYDATNNECIQWSLADANSTGYTKGREAQKYTIGDFPFYARVKLTIEDVSETDFCGFGLRKVEAFQADVNDYDEMVAMNCNAGDIQVASIKNNASTAVQVNLDGGTNWVNREIHTFTVGVSKSGYCEIEYDDVPKPMNPTFTFDNGDVVTPFFYFLHSTNSTAGVTLIELEHGRGL